MHKTILNSIAVGTMAIVPAAMAAPDNTQETRFYIAPMASYTFSDSNIFEPDDGVGGQLSIGKNFGDYFGIELYAFHFNDIELGSQFGSGANADYTGFGASALFFPARDTLPVYLVVGAGIGQHDFDDFAAGANPNVNDQDTDFYDVGVGYMLPLNDYGIKLRTEYRYRSTDVDGENGDEYYFRDNVVSVGVQIPLGAPAEATPTPAPTPADSDGDGVIDANDQCPGTPPGVVVDATGCPVEKTAPVVLQGVHFAFDSAQLSPEATSRLDNASNALQANPEVRFSIAGHTDSIGTNAYNQGLSERRAQSVKNYLIESGIGLDRITGMVGYGETRPIATNETRAGRAQNRRVELNVTDR